MNLFKLIKREKTQSSQRSFIKMLLYNSVCKLWIELFGTKDRRKLKYYISLCLIFKDEAPFLKEWIKYHLTIGVDHFYLYNNNSNDNYLEILQPFIDNGVVTLIDFPQSHAQFTAYQDCYDKYRNSTNWISFLDIDEFIVPKYKDNIKSWLEDYLKYPAIIIHWLIFGTSGKMNHDYSKGVIEQYYLCQQDLYKCGKCIINTRYNIVNWNTWYAHHHTYMYTKIFGVKMTIPAVNQFKRISTINKFGLLSKKRLREKATIQINHYQTKSWDLWQKKMARGCAYNVEHPRNDIYKQKEMDCFSVDYTIMRYLMKTRYEHGSIV